MTDQDESRVWARELLGALDRERELIAHGIHNRPIQHVVAARMVFESLLGDRRDEFLVGLGLDALERAANSARDLMWALTDPAPRREELASDLAENLERRGPGVAVTAAVDEASAAALHVAVVAVHDLAVTAPEELGPLAVLDLKEDAESLEAMVRWQQPVPTGLEWHGRTLARLRLAVHGGSLEPVDGALAVGVPLEQPSP